MARRPLPRRALACRPGRRGTASVQTFTGEDRFVSEYFRHELLSRLPEDEARFLMHTSVLDSMSGGLCDAVLQTTRSASTLERLERSNGFVVPLDRRGEWYRYHHLFGQLLRNELERSEPTVVAVLHRRAMTWCVANDLAEAAVRYGHAAGEKDTVAGLIDTLAQPLYYDGRMATVEEWLGWFGDEDLVRFPALAVFGAWFRAMTGRPADAARWLSLADGATSAIPLSDGSATIEPWVANLRAFMMPDGVERALADAQLALGQFAPDSAWRPSALLIRGVAHALLGATDRARADLTAAVDMGLASGAADDAFAAQAELALLRHAPGAWGEAGQHARQAQALVEETGLGHYVASAIVHVAVARVALHEGRQSDARAALTRAHRLRPLLDHGIPWVDNPGQPRANTRSSRTRRGRRRSRRLQRLRKDPRAPPRPRLPRGGGTGAARARGGDVRPGRLLGDEPDRRGAPAASLPCHPSHLPRDRRAAVHLPAHRQSRGDLDVPQAQCFLTQRGDHARRRGRAPGERHLPTAGDLHLKHETGGRSRPPESGLDRIGSLGAMTPLAGLPHGVNGAVMPGR